MEQYSKEQLLDMSSKELEAHKDEAWTYFKKVKTIIEFQKV